MREEACANLVRPETERDTWRWQGDGKSDSDGDSTVVDSQIVRSNHPVTLRAHLRRSSAHHRRRQGEDLRTSPSTTATATATVTTHLTLSLPLPPPRQPGKK